MRVALTRVRVGGTHTHGVSGGEPGWAGGGLTRGRGHKSAHMWFQPPLHTRPTKYKYSTRVIAKKIYTCILMQVTSQAGGVLNYVS